MSKDSKMPDPNRSLCPIALALDLFGDKWTLVLLRDMVMGKSRYKEFQDSPEKIPTNILASRLKRLAEENFIDRVLYQEKPKRYQYLLTQKGRDMIPVLQAVVRWSVKYSPGCWQPPEGFWRLEP